MKYSQRYFFIHVTLFFLFSFLVLPCSILHAAASDAVELDVYQDEDWDDEDWDIEDAAPPINDRFESYNRFMFKFNDKVYRYVFNPISNVYDFIAPDKVQKSIHNVFSNLRMPIRFFNNAFQKKGKAASMEFGRFVINSTVGIGGLFDPAKAAFNLDAHSEDFGQTLGFYGMDAGPYIIWPILGPSTFRDTLGYIGNTAFNPTFWVSVYDIDPVHSILSNASIARRVNTYTYSIRDGYDRVVGEAFDPYIALQNAYIQNRLKKINE